MSRSFKKIFTLTREKRKAIGERKKVMELVVVGVGTVRAISLCALTHTHTHTHSSDHGMKHSHFM